MNNDTIFDRFQALTFDDVVVVPGYSEVLPSDVDTSAIFAGDIRLAVPLVSAAMDKVMNLASPSPLLDAAVWVWCTATCRSLIRPGRSTG